MHRSAAVMAGKSGRNAQGGQYLKQADVTQATEYVVPMPLQSLYVENRQDDHQPGEESYTSLFFKHLARTKEVSRANAMGGMERPYIRMGRSSGAAMEHLTYPSAKSRTVKQGLLQAPVGRIPGKDGDQVMSGSIEDYH
jgi:hypothetical protein